jgi:hypothetical protein
MPRKLETGGRWRRTWTRRAYAACSSDLPASCHRCHFGSVLRAARALTINETAVHLALAAQLLLSMDTSAGHGELRRSGPANQDVDQICRLCFFSL